MRVWAIKRGTKYMSMNGGIGWGAIHDAMFFKTLKELHSIIADPLPREKIVRIEIREVK